MTDTFLAPTRLIARTEPIDAPADVLDELGAGGFAWLSPETSFVTAGCVASIAPEEATAWLRELPYERHTSAPAGVGPLACGALPFAGHDRLFVPSSVVTRDADGAYWRTTIGTDDASTMRLVPKQPTRFSVAAMSGIDDWCRSVRDALGAIESGQLRKVVLARAIEVTADEPFDTRSVLTHLRRTQPGCITFAAGDFVGATPELLMRKRGAAVL